MRGHCFTMIGFVVVLFVFVGVGVFASEATAKPLSCKQVYTFKYLPGTLHKAMATSGGKLPSRSMEMQCGWARGYKSKQAAIDTALGDCRKADRNYKNKGDCEIIYAE
jgi:hypothetical protein